MNEKQEFVKTILNIVIEECTHDEDYDEIHVTADDVLSKKRTENVQMVRSLYVAQLKCQGYTDATIANAIHRKKRAVTEILSKAYDYKKGRKCYRLADARCTLRINDINPE